MNLFVMSTKSYKQKNHNGVKSIVILLIAIKMNYPTDPSIS